MNRSLILWSTVAGMLMMVMAAHAQPPQQRGQRGPGMMGAGMGLPQLVRIEAVRTEIGLTDEQAGQVREAMAPVRGRGEGERPNLREMSDQEREQWREQMASRTAEMEQKLAEILNAEQMTRLRQIQIQAMGNRALLAANVVKELGITEDQQEKMRTASREAMQGLRGAGAGERPDRERMAAAMEKVNAAMLDVLTDAQKANFEELKGKPFDVSQLRGAGPGAGAERRGGGRRGN
jgi:hypothetical protein